MICKLVVMRNGMVYEMVPPNFVQFAIEKNEIIIYTDTKNVHDLDEVEYIVFSHGRKWRMPWEIPLNGVPRG